MTAVLTHSAPATAGPSPVPGRRLAGLAFLGLVSAVLSSCVLVYTGAFSGSMAVTVEAGRAGTPLARGADVTLRGVRVGTVRAVRAGRSGVGVELALDPAMARSIPANVQARLLPRSLVGERFVELVPPARPDTDPIRAGAVIRRDRSVTAVELERVLDRLLPVLRTVDPAKLAVTLNALASALDGRGARLGADLAGLGSVLHRINAELPAAATTLASLATVGDAYADAAPQLAAALRDLGTASSALAQQRAQLAAFAVATTSIASRGANLLTVQGGRLIQLAAVAQPTLTTLARYSPEFGCILRGLTELQPRLDAAFAGGSLRITLEPAQPQAVPAAFPADPGPDCHGLGGPAASGGGAAMGTAGTARERAIVGVALAPVLGRPASEVPDVATLLFGPVARGTTVKVG